MSSPGYGGASMPITCAPRCMHAIGPAEDCRCSRCMGLAHGIAPLPPSVQLKLFADEPCSPDSSSPPGSPRAGASFNSNANDPELLEQGPARQRSAGDPAAARGNVAGEATSVARGDAPDGAIPAHSPECGVARRCPHRTSPASSDAHRRCPCGRVARWGSTRCSTCDPWPTIESVRGGFAHKKGRTT